MEGCRSPEALTEFGGLTFSFQMLMSIEALIMHQGHTQRKWQKAQTSAAMHPPGFSRTRRVAVNWVAPRGRVQAVGKSYRKQISLHVKKEGAASVDSENLILGQRGWGVGDGGGRYASIVLEHIRCI